MADTAEDRAQIQEAIKAQGSVVRQLKTEKAPKEKVQVLFSCNQIWTLLFTKHAVVWRIVRRL